MSERFSREVTTIDGDGQVLVAVVPAIEAPHSFLKLQRMILGTSVSRWPTRRTDERHCCLVRTCTINKSSVRLHAPGSLLAWRLFEGHLYSVSCILPSLPSLDVGPYLFRLERALRRHPAVSLIGPMPPRWRPARASPAAKAKAKASAARAKTKAKAKAGSRLPRRRWSAEALVSSSSSTTSSSSSLSTSSPSSTSDAGRLDADASADASADAGSSDPWSWRAVTDAGRRDAIRSANAGTGRVDANADAITHDSITATFIVVSHGVRWSVEVTTEAQLQELVADLPEGMAHRVIRYNMH